MAPNGGKDARKEAARQAKNAAAQRRILEAQAQLEQNAARDRDLLRRMAEIRADMDGMLRFVSRFSQW